MTEIILLSVGVAVSVEDFDGPGFLKRLSKRAPDEPLAMVYSANGVELDWFDDTSL